MKGIVWIVACLLVFAGLAGIASGQIAATPDAKMQTQAVVPGAVVQMPVAAVVCPRVVVPVVPVVPRVVVPVVPVVPTVTAVPADVLVARRYYATPVRRWLFGGYRAAVVLK